MSAEATVTDVLVQGRLDAAAHPSAPTPGWVGMPEEAATEALAARAVIGSASGS